MVHTIILWCDSTLAWTDFHLFIYYWSCCVCRLSGCSLPLRFFLSATSVSSNLRKSTKIPRFLWKCSFFNETIIIKSEFCWRYLMIWFYQAFKWSFITTIQGLFKSNFLIDDFSRLFLQVLMMHGSIFNPVLVVSTISLVVFIASCRPCCSYMQLQLFSTDKHWKDCFYSVILAPPGGTITYNWDYSFFF